MGAEDILQSVCWPTAAGDGGHENGGLGEHLLRHRRRLNLEPRWEHLFLGISIEKACEPGPP